MRSPTKVLETIAVLSEEALVEESLELELELELELVLATFDSAGTFGRCLPNFGNTQPVNNTEAKIKRKGVL